jgi:hypothetical protein
MDFGDDGVLMVIADPDAGVVTGVPSAWTTRRAARRCVSPPQASVIAFSRPAASATTVQSKSSCEAARRRIEGGREVAVTHHVAERRHAVVRGVDERAAEAARCET